MVKLLKLKNALDKKISKVSKEGTITTAIVPLFPLWENNYGNKNWKEYPKVQEVKENLKMKSPQFHALGISDYGNTGVCSRCCDHDVSDSYDAGKLHGTDDFCRRPFFINRAVYKFSSPQRGDMIVFRTSASDDAALHIRRVIGLPGETVQITGGRILINGEVYNEGKDFPMITNPGLAATAVTLESGEYFVLGDNRNNSEDSRYADIGMVRKRYIVGKIWFTCSPFEKLGFTKG